MIRRFTSTVAEPTQRGREFGTVHATEVAANIAAYSKLFAIAGKGVDLDGWGTKALARIDSWAPELGDEIRGIAAGADVPVAHVAAINARTEILGILGPLGVSECSTVVTLGTKTFAMQNWDWYAAMADNWLEWTIPHPDGRRVTTVTEYGIVGKIGVNDRGVGVLFNMLKHWEDGAGVGVPLHIVARRILDTAPDVATGVAICGSAGVSASSAITLVSQSSAVSVELWPSGPGHALPAADGVLVRTNHFLTENGRAGDAAPARGSNTLERYESVCLGLDRGRDESGALTPAGVLAALSSHDDTICCHPEPADPEELRHATLAHVRLDLAERSLEVTAGPPCGRPI